MRQHSGDNSSSTAYRGSSGGESRAESTSKRQKKPEATHPGETDTFSNLWLEPWPNVRYIFTFLIIITLLVALVYSICSVVFIRIARSFSHDSLQHLEDLGEDDVLRFDASSRAGASPKSEFFLHSIQMREVIRNPFGWDTAAADGAWYLTQSVELATALLSAVLPIGLLLLLLPCRRSRDAHQRRD